MTIHRSGAAWAGGAILCIAGGAALADVTPADVWADWSAGMADYGFDVSAREVPAGDDLVLNDVVMALDAPEGGADVEMSFPEMTLRDNGDGTVAVILPSSLPVSVAVKGPEPVSFTLLYQTSELDMTVSGDASAMIYAYTAARIGLTMTDLVSEGEPVKLDSATMSLENVQSRTAVTPGTLRRSEQQITTGPVRYDLAMTEDGEAPETFTASGRFDSIEAMSAAILPEGIGLGDMAAAVAAGFAADGSVTFGAGASTAEATEEGGVTRTSTTSGGGVLSVKTDDTGMRYGVTSSDLSVELTSPDLPVPVALAMKEATLDLKMPIAPKEEAQDFGLNLHLGDVTAGDALWALFDAEAKLPRDPASLALDVTGKARVMASLMDPATMQAPDEGDTPPAQLETLSLNRLLLRLAGAELAGKGDLAFDNSDTEAYDGMPKPVGDIDLTLSGSNALLDRLVAMGLVPEDQVMGMRMMLSIFTVPGDGEDMLKSRIEFTEEGQILANGQRLK